MRSSSLRHPTVFSGHLDQGFEICLSGPRDDCGRNAGDRENDRDRDHRTGIEIVIFLTGWRNVFAQPFCALNDSLVGLPIQQFPL